MKRTWPNSVSSAAHHLVDELTDRQPFHEVDVLAVDIDCRGSPGNGGAGRRRLDDTLRRRLGLGLERLGLGRCLGFGRARLGILGGGERVAMCGGGKRQCGKQGN
jgi:hypothetical protein